MGIGTTNPLQKLHVLGNLLVAAGSSTGQHITQKAYELNSGTLSWEGTAGQLFSITNNLTSGSIFSVNDVSGIPSIDVNANGTVSMVSYGGSVGIGTALATQKLHVQGGVRITGGLYDINNNVGTAGSVLISTGAGVSWTNSVSGSGSNLSISTSVVSQSQYLSFVSGASTSVLGISTVSQPIVFTPSSGRLGIGTTNPAQKLHVVGNVLVSGAVTTSDLFVQGANNTEVFSVVGVASTASNTIFEIVDFTDSTIIEVKTGDSPLLNSDILISPTGATYVGIGTTNPIQPLDVYVESRFERAIRVATAGTTSYYTIEHNGLSGTLDFTFFAS